MHENIGNTVPDNTPLDESVNIQSPLNSDKLQTIPRGVC